MEMNEIMVELTKKLEELMPQVENLETTVMFHRNALIGAEESLKALKNNKDALEMALESLKSGTFGLDIKKDEPKTEEVKAKIRRAVKQLEWKHKDAHVIQKDRDEKIVNRWPSQRAAAKELKMSQANVSLYMKAGKDEQLRKRDYYLSWEY